MVRFITVTSTQRGTFSRRDVAVLQKESSPSPLKRQPEKAEDEEDVNESSIAFWIKKMAVSALACTRQAVHGPDTDAPHK